MPRLDIQPYLLLELQFVLFVCQGAVLLVPQHHSSEVHLGPLLDRQCEFLLLKLGIWIVRTLSKDGLFQPTLKSIFHVLFEQPLAL